MAEVAEAFRREAERSGIVVSVDGSQAIPEQLVDPVRMREVVSNLVVNAIRAMPSGGALSIRVKQQSDSVAITVRDSGTGISPEDQERIFERFHKGGESRGTGLGLTISRDLVRAHGGRLELVESSPMGTTMRVVLPFDPA